MSANDLGFETAGYRESIDQLFFIFNCYKNLHKPMTITQSDKDKQKCSLHMHICTSSAVQTLPANAHILRVDIVT